MARQIKRISTVWKSLWFKQKHYDCDLYYMWLNHISTFCILLTWNIQICKQ